MSSLDDAMFGTAGAAHNILPLACQLRAFDRLVDEAFEQRRSQYNDPGFRQAVKMEARKRMITGFDTYGDSSWRKTAAQLEREEIEEDADGEVYRVIRLWQGR